MENNLTTIRYLLNKYSEYESGALPEIVDKYFLMGSPLPIILIISSYLAFVCYLGPMYMKNRQPYNIKNILIAYNALQMFYNMYMVYLYHLEPNFLPQLFSFGCASLSQEEKLAYYSLAYYGFWVYTINKVLDLVDTIFLVLRKNQKNVTVLHVYHHVVTLSASWILLKYYPGQEAALVGILNTIIHSIMYFYYLVAAFGPKYRKYLWWKQYITMMQMGQFVLVMIYHTLCLYFSCGYNMYAVKGIIAHALINLLLFVNFYNQTYNKKRKVESQTEKKID